MSFVDEYTRFIFLEDEPEAADVIFVPGSDQGCLARRAAGLWKAGYASYIIPSGKYGKLAGRFLADPTCRTECEYFTRILLEEGVPQEAILCEDEATYTYENAMKSRVLTDRMGIRVEKAILCCQAYHARRAKLYYQVCFPEAQILVCPVNTKGISKDNWYLSEAGTELVLNEMKHCGTQFHEIFKEFREGVSKNNNCISEGFPI